MSNATGEILVRKCEEVSELLASLAHPIRLKVLCKTLEKERSVGELTQFCSISQSAMSQFLARMKSDGLLESRREGTKIFYAVKDQRVKKLLNAIREVCS